MTKKTRSETIELQPMYLRGEFVPETIDEKKRTVDIRWTTGARVLRQPFFSEPFYEELSLDPAHVRMGRLNNGAPLLDAHQRYRVRDQIGIVEKASLSQDGGDATVRFSDRDEVEPIFNDVKGGIIRNASHGYKVYRYEDVSGENDKIPTYRAVDWEPMEISLVPVGADPGATVRSAETKYQCEVIKRDQGTEEDTMTVEKIEKKNGDGTPIITEEEVAKREQAAADEAVKADRERADEILTLTRKFKLDDAFGRDLIKSGVTIEKAREQVIDKLAEKQEEQGEVRSHITVCDLEIDKRRECMEEAILHRADPERHELTDKGRGFRGMNLMDMARESIEVVGGRHRGFSRREIATIALNLDPDLARRAGMHSTSDFPNILANTINRSLRDAYKLADRTFVKWCRKSTAPDFKEVARTQLSEMTKLKPVAPGGEYKYMSFGDSAEKYSLSKYGGIVAITWESIVNDDLGAFSRIPISIAEEAAATEGDIVYAIFTGNPNMSDGVALFHADHGNLAASPGAISDTSLTTGRKAMREQKGPKGRVLNLVPKFVICGPAQEANANKYTSASFVAAKASDINPNFNTSLEPIVDARITDNAWGLAAEPNRIDTIEYAYLEGEEGLFIEKRVGFEVDGLQIKARHVFAAKAIDHRSLYKDNGS